MISRVEILIGFLVLLNTLSSVFMWVLVIKILEKISDEDEPEKDEKKIEQDLTTRLRDLQTRQFSLDLTSKRQQKESKNDEKR